MNPKRPLLLLATLSTGSLALAAHSVLPAVQDDAALARAVLVQADRMTDRVFPDLARGGNDPCDRVALLALHATVLGLRADLAKNVASCINEESGSPTKFAECMKEALAEFGEGLDEAGEQDEARRDLCDLLGGGIYDPDLDEDEMEARVDHPYLPLLTGATWMYEKDGEEGLEEVFVEVLDETITIDDIECIVVRDTVTLDGVLVEDTRDYFAQHEDGTVWYLGEIALNYEDGEVVDVEGSWRAGEDGALPGTILQPIPIVGSTYRQELLLTEAEDAATVLSVDETVTIGIGTFVDCVQTLDLTPLEPDAFEHKYYAPGIGVVLEVDLESGERLELVSFTPGS